MTRIAQRLISIGLRGHLSETRLNELAGAATGPTPPAGAAEQAHLDDCARCRGLLAGYRRADAVLSGAWTDRPLRTETEALASGDRAGRLRVGPLRIAGGAASRPGRRWMASFGAVAVLVAVVAGAGLLELRGSGPPPASGSPSAMLTTPAGTGFVARLPIDQYGTFSWSPDGAHLLVSDDSGSRVYDRFGKLVSNFAQREGWLDASHLVAGDGHVSNFDENYTSESVWKSGLVVAGGHGSAAIIVAVPACTGDPIVDWYDDGHYAKAGEKATPYGWSPDGKLVLLGHMDCSSQDAETNGWKGPVEVVDFATRKVLATAPAVRGEMAFNPSWTRLAAESDQNLEIVDIATGQVKIVPDARLLGWSNDDIVAYRTPVGTIGTVGATAEIQPFGGISAAWSTSSSIGLELVADASGNPLYVLGANGKPTLDLSSAGLELVPDVARPVPDVGPRLSALWHSPWSPDGRMLAFRSTAAVELYSVDPGGRAESGAPSAG
ncbi:MAG TPA: hypothetical protein VIK06_08070 [Candidatus Limnocylindrales bacterium]